MNDEKLHTMNLMVEREQCYVDQVRQELASGQSKHKQRDLDMAVRRLAKLQEQLQTLQVLIILFSTSNTDGGFMTGNDKLRIVVRSPCRGLY